MVKRIQRNEEKGIRHPANTLYCGWPTERGNSFPIGEKYTREEALEVFRRAFWANELPMTPERARAELADYDFLPCLCRLDQPSHVDEYTRDIRCEHMVPTTNAGTLPRGSCIGVPLSSFVPPIVAFQQHIQNESWHVLAVGV